MQILSPVHSFIHWSRYQVVIIFDGLCAVPKKPWIFVLLQFVVKNDFEISECKNFVFLVTTDCKKKKKKVHNIVGNC